jgi:hypothetical protein
MVRRSLALVGALIVVILLVIAVRGCIDARRNRALKEYARDVGALLQQSGQQSTTLFNLLSGKGGPEQEVSLENTLNTLRGESAALVDRAHAADVPDELKRAQRYLLDALEFRRDGLAEIADALPVALSDRNRRQGSDNVARQMRDFLTSDTIYSGRVEAKLRKPLAKAGVLDEVGVPKSQFLPDIAWLDPGTVADRISRIRTGRGGAPATPGLHGDALGSVTLGGQTLTPGGSATITLASNPQFQVQVTNQGQSTETDVPVKIAIGRGPDAIDREGRLDSIPAGQTKSLTIPLRGSPPTGQNVPIQVTVEAVPGEKKTDNNKGSFSAIFTR